MCGDSAIKFVSLYHILKGQHATEIWNPKDNFWHELFFWFVSLSVGSCYFLRNTGLPLNFQFFFSLMLII